MSLLEEKNATSKKLDVVTFNVGGRSFATTRETLFSVNDTFFTSLLSGRLESCRDENGAIFIDRDPHMFAIILNYLRTQQLFNVNDFNIDMLRHEAEFYGIAPLRQQLGLLEDLINNTTCGGDIFFQSLLRPSKPSDADVDFDARVKQIVTFDNGVVIVFKHYVECYRLSEHFGWQSVFKTPYVKNDISYVACHFEFVAGNLCVMLGISEQARQVSLWEAKSSPRDPFSTLFDRSRHFALNTFSIREIGRYDLKDCAIDSLIFVGTQLVALSQKMGRVGIRNSTRRWYVQDLKPLEGVQSTITAFDKAGSEYLFLSSNHGIIYLIDMQKFPLRLKDGDLLINEFYKDPENEEISTISCFLCPASPTGKSIEIAYGTRNGTVRILVHHPETVGLGPQLFQTFKVHLSPIWRINLYHDYLITVCTKLHVRTWKLARFRSLISTQPGTTAHASFKVFDGGDGQQTAGSIDVGPYGTQKDEGESQVFMEMPQTNTNNINILYASNGQKIVSIKSVDDSPTTCVTLFHHDMFGRLRCFIITGHVNGFVQIWDLTTAMEREPYSHSATRQFNKAELIKQILQTS